MLTQLSLLDDSSHIRAALELPREVKRQRRNAARQSDRANRSEIAKLLQMPLFGEELLGSRFFGAEDRTAEEATMESVGPDAIGVGPEIDDPVLWTNDDIVSLHSAMFEENLKALAAKGNPMEKLDILEWMFEPDFVGEVIRRTPHGDRRVFVFTDQVPFSFAFCCKLQGHDPEKYRAFVRRVLPEVAKRFLYLAGEDLPCLQDALTPFRTPF